MTLHAVTPRSRRTFLAGALGAAAAAVATALGRPSPVLAGKDGDVVLGAANTTTTMTTITNSENPIDVFWGISKSGGKGVAGHSDSGAGVHGSSTSFVGVFATCPGGVGLHAGTVTGNAGVEAYAHDNTGVFATSGIVVPVAPAKTGVYGFASQDSSARGVTGETTAGRGLNGIATTGTGVYASATQGIALHAVGRVHLDKCAGVTTIASATDSALVTPSVRLVATSTVFATLQGDAGGATVESVLVDTAANRFIIYLTRPSTTNVRVAWLVFG